MDIREYLQHKQILTDGAMGTYYNQCYPNESGLVEEENQLHPDRIKEIHKEYLRSGATLLRTNTFATNSNFFDMRPRLLDNIRAGYQIARESVEEYQQEELLTYQKNAKIQNMSMESVAKWKEEHPIYVAADMGTVFDMEWKDEQEVFQEYQSIVDVFVEEGAEIFLLETQSDFAFIQKICSYIKVKQPNSFIMVSFSFDKTGYTKAGVRLERMIQVIGHMAEVDAYGLNCGMEGAHMYQLLSQQAFPNDKYLIALPNAGYPYVLRGKTIYGKNEKYFQEMEEKLLQIGIDIIGGCCGTTPTYIERVRPFIEENNKYDKKLNEDIITEKSRTESEFWKKLKRGEKPFIVELDPPFDIHAEKVIDGARKLMEHDVDLLTLSDSPMARTRMDASLLGSLIQKEVGIQVMPHISCRDRNVISLRGTMIGDYLNEIKHFLIVTGDPVAQSDRSMVTQVFDYNSIKFMRMVQEMNEDIFAQDKVVYGGALNYHGVNADAIAKRMQTKMESGCTYFLTQPVYSNEDVERLAYLKEKTGAKIMAGIMPLVSYKNAMFLANEMPGIHIPEDIVAQYTPGMTREEAQQKAEEISVDIARKLTDVADGYYFMTPFNRVELICNVIEKIRDI